MRIRERERASEREEFIDDQRVTEIGKYNALSGNTPLGERGSLLGAILHNGMGGQGRMYACACVYVTRRVTRVSPVSLWSFGDRLR
jgi:hypothetical protein